MWIWAETDRSRSCSFWKSTGNKKKRKSFAPVKILKSKIWIRQQKKKQKRDENKNHLEEQLNNTTEKLNNYNKLNKIKNALNEISYK